MISALVSLPEVLAFSHSGIKASLSLLYRKFWPEPEHTWLLTFLNSLLGGLVLLPWYGSTISELTTWSAFLLLINGALWTACVYFDIRAFEKLDVSSNAILGTGQMALVASIGSVCFNENFSEIKILGSLLVASSIIIVGGPVRWSVNSGVLFRVLTIITAAIAISLDKYLTTLISAKLVIIAGYFLPALICLLLKPSTAKKSYALLRSRPKQVILTSLVFALSGPTIIGAIALGDLGTSVVLAQTSVVLASVGAYLLLKERDHLAQRAIGVMAAFAGACLIVKN